MGRTVAIITARGGSKRIPRKNIKDFLGKPIIAYSITAALEAGCFDEVMVSTDDQEIAEVALSYGAKIPFYRSSETSNDFATTPDVLSEVLLEYKQRGEEFTYACCIYPTAPFVTAENLKRGYGLLREKDGDSAFPVACFGFPILRSLKIEDGFLRMIWPENLNTRSQDLPPAYHDSGQFYWLNVERFLKTKRIYSDRSVPIEIPESEVQDIDNEEDWKIAEIKYQMIMTK
ncbi:MAG: pseudaminic acid cytidylyltransferase [Desulfuromonadales bacterium]